MDFKLNKFIDVLILFIFIILFIDIYNVTCINNYLQRETSIINEIIQYNDGQCNALYEYLSNKNYVFLYNEENIERKGEIISYELKKETNSVSFGKKVIIVKSSILLY